ncbi:MAG: hypothetical protein VKL97_05595 [Cyanobacteriota bacterium]|nr:hypothetical protein [Cyanobacteriota bacterium]
MHFPEASDRQPLRLTSAQRRALLEVCLQLECDIDPMILRARQLRHQGAWPQAVCLEQELLPLF